MNKIPTLFVRDFEHSNGRYVTEEVTPGCEWVLAGEGVPTRKYDGTCVMFDGEKWWARREVKAPRGVTTTLPDGFDPISYDETTEKWMGWEPIEQSGFAKFHTEAIAGENFRPGTYELCGPKINKNPEKFDMHILVPHDRAAVVPDPVTRSYDSLRFILTGEGTTPYPDEGIVWHHPDGRMAKLKVRDFPRE